MRTGHRRFSALRALAVVVLAGTSCLEDEKEVAVDVNFTINCTLADRAGNGVSGETIHLVAYKIDYEGEPIDHSRFDLEEATRSFGTGLPMADFQFGYTLHKKGDSQEYMSASCSTMNPATAKVIEVAYDEALAAAGSMQRTLNIIMMP